MMRRQDGVLWRIARWHPLPVFLFVLPFLFFTAGFADYAASVALLAGFANLAFFLVYLGYPLFLLFLLPSRFASQSRRRLGLALGAFSAAAGFGFGIPFVGDDLVGAADAGNWIAETTFLTLLLAAFAGLFYLQIAAARVLNEAERGRYRRGFRTLITWLQLFYLPFCIYFLQRRVRSLVLRYETCDPIVTTPPMEKLAIEKGVSGHISLELTERIGWDDFEAYANEILRRLDARVIERATTVDMHLWDIEVDTVPLRLVYEDFPNRVMLESNSFPGDFLLNKLQARLTPSA